MSYSTDELTQEQIATQNLCIEEVSEVLAKHKCHLETKVEILGDKIYPSVVVRTNPAHSNGRISAHRNGVTKEK